MRDSLREGLSLLRVGKRQEELLAYLGSVLVLKAHRENRALAAEEEAIRAADSKAEQEEAGKDAKAFGGWGWQRSGVVCGRWRCIAGGYGRLPCRLQPTSRLFFSH
jgi:hypothetical protein